MSVAGGLRSSLLGSLQSTSPGQYKSSGLHDKSRDWPETNCYMDLWIELIHAFGGQPEAMLPVVFGVDFEGDHFTFFKPSLTDIYDLYGVDVQELQTWRGIIPATVEQLNRGCIVMPEVDAFFLPDTLATDYRKKHSKSSIAICSMDLERRYCKYFHNAGFFELEGDDFELLFGLKRPEGTVDLSPYTEFAKIDGFQAKQDLELMGLSSCILNRVLKTVPKTNPFSAFRASFLEQVPVIKEHGMEMYHGYVFANVRHAGSAFELGSQYLKWAELRGQQYGNAGEHCAVISDSCKKLLLKLARAVSSSRQVDFSELFDTLERSWEAAMGVLKVN